MKLTTYACSTLVLPAMLLLAMSAPAFANPFPSGNVMAGQKLFDDHDCNQCHNTIMGGDGYKIFTRLTRKINTPDALIAQIGMCSGNVNAHFTSKETQDLAAYLNTFYKFK